MTTVQFEQYGCDWYVRVMAPARGEIARFGPYTQSERDAFAEGAEAFAAPFSVVFEKVEE